MIDFILGEGVITLKGGDDGRKWTLVLMTHEAKELLDLLLKIFNVSTNGNAISDDELFSLLRERGCSGKLKQTKEIDI